MSSNKTNIYRFRETAGADERYERIADGAYNPGHYVYEAGGKVKKWVTAVLAAPRALFGRDRDFQGTSQVDIDATYTDAETSFYDEYYEGDVVRCHIPDGETIVVDDYLTPDTAGGFTKGVSTNVIVLQAIEAITTSGASGRIEARVVNPFPMA